MYDYKQHVFLKYANSDSLRIKTDPAETAPQLLWTGPGHPPSLSRVGGNCSGIQSTDHS